MAELRAIDGWVNVNMGELGRPDYLVQVKENYFKGGDEFFKNLSLEETLAQMDEAGVERAILTTDALHPSPHVLSFPRANPDRFAVSLTLDPRRGMKAIRALEALVRSEPIALARIVPFYID